MTSSTEGMINQVKVTVINLGNGKRLKVELIGDKKGTMIQKNEVKVPILMKNAKYVPLLYCNLFRITAALGEGCRLEGDINRLKLIKKGQVYVFDRQVKSGKSSLFAMKIINDNKKTLKLENNKLRNNKQCYLMNMYRSTK